MEPVHLATVVQIADFRVALRTFVARSDAIVREVGLTSQRYLLLLVIKGAPDRSERARFTDVAERLSLDRTTVTELVARAERAGLIRREPSEDDRRAVYLRLTTEGEARLGQAISALEGERRALAEAFGRLRTTFRNSPAG